MFDHPMIQVYAFEEIPLDQDLHLMDEKWMSEFEAAMIRSVDGSDETAYSVGYYAAAAARAIAPEYVELSWYPNIYDRFHQVRITLPRHAFITCVGSWQYDYDPVVFVRGDWLTNLYLRSHSVFALIDAIGVKNELTSGRLTRSKLIELRCRIDEIAADNLAVAFISFADSLLLKSNYTVGQYDSNIKYTYEPEKILRLLPDIRAAYADVLGLKVYAAMAQGSNEYYEDTLLHVSGTKNHVSLNSIGLPFAQTQAIEQSARAAIKSHLHGPADAYLDEAFYHSLRFRFGFAKNEEAKFSYLSPMAAGPTFYFPVSLKLLLDNLEPAGRVTEVDTPEHRGKVEP
jgi:hypothetical protein